MQLRGLEPVEEALRVELAAEREAGERGDRAGRTQRRALLLEPRQAGEREGGERGEAGNEVDDVGEVGKLTIREGQRRDGRKAQVCKGPHGLHVRMRDRERAQGWEGGEYAREGGLDGAGSGICGRFLGGGGRRWTDNCTSRTPRVGRLACVKKFGDGELADVEAQLGGRVQQPLEGLPKFVAFEVDGAEEVEARREDP